MDNSESISNGPRNALYDFPLYEEVEKWQELQVAPESPPWILVA